MTVKYGTLCETGLERETNQDRIFARINKNISVFAIADGMGGHSDGEFASEKVIESIEFFSKEFSNHAEDIQALTDKIIGVLNGVNDEIFRYAASKNIICGSTVSVLLLSGDLFATINVGDSPVYRADKKSAACIYTKHSYENIRLKSAGTYPEKPDIGRAGKLTQAVGAVKNICPSAITGRVHSEQAFLLCSDGISSYFSEKTIFKYLKNTAADKIEPDELICKLKHRVYRAGAKDNLSAIALRIES